MKQVKIMKKKKEKLSTFSMILKSLEIIILFPPLFTRLIIFKDYLYQFIFILISTR